MTANRRRLHQLHPGDEHGLDVVRRIQETIMPKLSTRNATVRVAKQTRFV